ncbi:MAG: cation diffusion facilitator family transporter [Candidatus Margulisbacteria bacterium]|nr:cation diffusion facilitator family transporter [Candidatus Margulisiibacteriota bacterium]
MSTHNHSQASSETYNTNRTALTLALSITALMMVLEFVGGLVSGSLALLSDAGHMLTDTGALALALFALWFSRRPATPEKTYGFYRIEILSALLNGSLLIVIAGYIFFEAVQRFISPTEVRGSLMLAVAAIGLVANLVGAFILSKGSKENLNVKAALWHILSDAFSSIGVIVAGLIIIFTGVTIVDPIIGFIIGLVILRGAWRVVKESVDILLEATPKHIKHEEVVKALKNVQGVRDVHDLHIWTITSGLVALSAHVLIEDTLVSKCGDVSRTLKKILKGKFGISHATMEFECENCPDGLVCRIQKEK